MRHQTPASGAPKRPLLAAPPPPPRALGSGPTRVAPRHWPRLGLRSPPAATAATATAATARALPTAHGRSSCLLGGGAGA
eukprot:4981763-Prymnesium_polylepis.1